MDWLVDEILAQNQFLKSLSFYYIVATAPYRTGI